MRGLFRSLASSRPLPVVPALEAPGVAAREAGRACGGTRPGAAPTEAWVRIAGHLSDPSTIDI